jgi:Uma2 family endonuclease
MSTTRARRTRVKLDRRSNGMLMTPQEFDAVRDYDERYVYELVHGVVIVSPPPARAERGPNEELGYILRLHKETHPQGSALDATLPEDTIATADSRRRADRVIWAGLGRDPNESDIPTIAIEFVSRSKRDRQRDYEEKRREYLALGVVEYWIFDRFQRRMTVLRNTPAGVVEQVIGADGVYQTPLLPGFELPIARLLASADRWKRRKA